MATIQFDLVSPERKLASIEASEIQIPGADGDFTAMADHAPVLTTLRPGVLRVVAGNETSEYLVTGGFVELSATNASVLAEQALPVADVTRELVDGLVEAATTAAETADPSEKDAAHKRIADTKALLELV
ncbi:ATP synthase epsilon chain [Amylibacter marinus]|uniref:ATP synthase epsilon chain n=1 Tax=Amylibacter marinus TaxID=1475483 RepID=A0ABQ5VXS3_9RHOB|nr:F0F1 ATP synthase subunit epsilon [Amylibacter marinus]GLQ36070.1 ATP synthase epsilon chain [Amylibacter marinus]